MTEAELVALIHKTIDERIDVKVIAGVSAPRRATVVEVLPSTRTLMAKLDGGGQAVPIRGYPMVPRPGWRVGDEIVVERNKAGWSLPAWILDRDMPLGRDPVNVLDYGAVGDNVHDDTAAIQNAIAAAILTNRQVYLPAGFYRITSTLIVNASDVTMFGDGTGGNHNTIAITIEGATMITWDGAAGQDMLYVRPEPGTNHLVNVTVEGIGFTGNVLAAHAIHVRSVIWGKFRAYVEKTTGEGFYSDCWVQGTVGGANALASGQWSDVQNCIIDIVGRQVVAGCGPIAGFYGDEWTGTSTADTSLCDIWIRGSYGGAATAHGAVVGNTDNNTFHIIEVFDQSAGGMAAKGVWFRGSNVTGAASRKNKVYRMAPGLGGLWLEGTDSVTFPTDQNTVKWIDRQGNPPVQFGAKTGQTNIIRGDQDADRTPTYAVLPDDSTAITGTNVNIVGATSGEILQWNIRNGHWYLFDLWGLWKSTTTNNGVALGIVDTGTGAVEALWQSFGNVTSAATASAPEWLAAELAGVGVGTAFATGTWYRWTLQGRLFANASGTCQVVAKRVGAGAGTINISGGSGGVIIEQRDHTAGAG